MSRGKVKEGGLNATLFPDDPLLNELLCTIFFRHQPTYFIYNYFRGGGLNATLFPDDPLLNYCVQNIESPTYLPTYFFHT